MLARERRASSRGSSRSRPCPSTYGDRERLADEEVAVDDRERVAVERAHGRARRSGCPRCRTGRRGRGSRSPTGSPGSCVTSSVVRRRACSCELAVRLHRAAEVRAVVRDDREARLLAEEAVVADEGRPPRDDALRRVRGEGRDQELALGEVARSGRGPACFTPCLRNAGPTTKPSTGSVTRPPITPPSPSVETSRKTDARIALVGGRRRAARGARPSRRRGGRFSGSTSGASCRSAAAGEVADPEEREDERDHRADRRRSTTETTKPTSSTTTPTAKPTGQRLGPGTCGCSRLGSKSPSNKYHK